MIYLNKSSRLLWRILQITRSNSRIMTNYKFLMLNYLRMSSDFWHDSAKCATKSGAQVFSTPLRFTRVQTEFFIPKLGLMLPILGIRSSQSGRVGTLFVPTRAGPASSHLRAPPARAGGKCVGGALPHRFRFPRGHFVSTLPSFVTNSFPAINLVNSHILYV